MLFDPSSFAIPVRILKDPEPSQLIITTVSLVGSFLLGVVASPLTAVVTEKLHHRRKIKTMERNLYDELARFLAVLDRLPENETIDGAMIEVLTNQTWPTYHEYMNKEFISMLEVDRERGLIFLVGYIEHASKLIVRGGNYTESFWKMVRGIRNQLQVSRELKSINGPLLDELRTAAGASVVKKHALYEKHHPDQPNPYL